jgi:hypothetical protein
MKKVSLFLKTPHAKQSLTLYFVVVGIYYTGLDCTGRLFISERAHLVFDFHQIVDGLKEVELGGSSCVSSFPHLNLAQLTKVDDFTASVLPRKA